MLGRDNTGSGHMCGLCRWVWWRWALACLCGAWLATSTGCNGNGLHDNVYTKFNGELRYRIGAISKQWRFIKVTENDIAYYHPVFKSMIQVNSTCRKDYEDVSLSTLTDHVFYGLRERKIVIQQKRMIDRRAALYTEILAKLDGVAIKAAVVVLKKNTCAYDFTYISRPDNFGRGLGAYYRVINGFKVLSS